MDTRINRTEELSNSERKRRAAAEHNARYEKGGASAVAARGLIVPAGMSNRASRNAALMQGKTKRSRPLVKGRHPDRKSEAAGRGLTNIHRLIDRATR